MQDSDQHLRNRLGEGSTDKGPQNNADRLESKDTPAITVDAIADDGSHGNGKETRGDKGNPYQTKILLDPDDEAVFAGEDTLLFLFAGNEFSEEILDDLGEENKGSDANDATYCGIQCDFPV